MSSADFEEDRIGEARVALGERVRPSGGIPEEGKGAHRGEGLRARLPAALLPDLNPIEEALSKVEHILRKVGARTKEALIEAIGRALGAVSVHDAKGFFVNCGYRTPAQQL
jgi:hypothetical protein